MWPAAPPAVPPSAPPAVPPALQADRKQASQAAALLAESERAKEEAAKEVAAKEAAASEAAAQEAAAQEAVKAVRKRKAPAEVPFEFDVESFFADPLPALGGGFGDVAITEADGPTVDECGIVRVTT